ncbi:MAG: acetate--CoA ligase family protein [Candidatus Aenigmatarchaeota archaeon]
MGLFGRSKKRAPRKMAKKPKKVKRSIKKKVKKVRRVRPKIKRRVKKMKTVKKIKPKVKPKKIMVKKVEKPEIIKPSFNKMPDEKAFEILKRFRIKVPDYDFCKNEKELEIALKKVGYPCVMKVSGEIIHKTDVSGVRTNITNEEEARKNFNELIKIKGSEKVLVQKMVEEGYEIIVGGKKDPQFSRVVALGAGGIFTELLKDVSFRIVPLSRMDAEEMLREVKFSSVLLKGFRGKKPANPESIVDAILAVSKIMERYPKIKELDINPMFATPTKAIATDVRIILE